MSVRRSLMFLLAWALFNCTNVALACSACYGKSDSALAKGMNMGIFVLLGFIGLVLVAVAAFFVFIVRRAATVQPVPEIAPNSN